MMPLTRLLYIRSSATYHHLHNVNCQRADRMTMAHGLEARVPFLDPNVIDAVMQVDPEYKRIEGEEKPEKHALRALFDGEIPDPVLWRTKAMQCEGVGLNWVADLQTFCESQVSDEDFAKAESMYPINPPQSKEEMYYRRLFESNYKNMDKFVHVWEGAAAQVALLGKTKHTRVLVSRTSDNWPRASRE